MTDHSPPLRSAHTPFETVTLTGTQVCLEPLTIAHAGELRAAVDGPRDTYTYAWVPTPDTADVDWYIAEAERQHAAGAGLTFATMSLAHAHSDGRPRLVGSTRFMEAEYWSTADRRPRHGVTPDALEVGGTWVTPLAQRSAVNTEAKLLMLGHAFEVIGVQRVTIKTDARNERSRRAIERLGAEFEGVRRAHMRGSDGAVRNTAMYSILASQWPRVAAHLRTLLAGRD